MSLQIFEHKVLQYAKIVCGRAFCETREEEMERRRQEKEEGRKATEERKQRSWRGDDALGTDRGMNNLSTLLMDRLGEKMKRDGARERRKGELWWGEEEARLKAEEGEE
ncbi:hypothetical protein NQZ68_025188 [Dissostichus eleginoides]|nr:hypothetical protein NQZ68_025188 [Dissostichus eleginoides]